MFPLKLVMIFIAVVTYLQINDQSKCLTENLLGKCGEMQCNKMLTKLVICPIMNTLRIFVI